MYFTKAKMDKICFVEYWILWNNKVQVFMLKGLPCVNVNITNGMP
jgi:hypothetical protein